MATKDVKRQTLGTAGECGKLENVSPMEKAKCNILLGFFIEMEYGF